MEIKSRALRAALPWDLWATAAMLTTMMTGCFAPPSTDNSSSANTSPTGTPTITPAGGVRAAKIIFKVPSGGSDSGSFNEPAPGGTLTVPGLGHEAVRVFNPNGTLLSSSGPGSVTWPKWLTKVEIGISGTNNGAAKNSNCARFTSATDPGGKCYDAVAATNWDCSAPAGYYRVSEYDCLRGDTTDTITDGNGDGDDGVYVRAHFSRETANLDPSENIMAVIEYSASAISAPSEAVTCFTGGVFSPETCSDITWKMFLRSTASADAVPPFLMLIPPAIGLVNKSLKVGGTGVTARQVFLPLASDTSIQVFQLSRIKSRLTKNDNTLNTTCSNNNNGTGNSPLCAGMILYSITFYRI